MIWRRLKRLVSALVLTTLILAGPWPHHDRVICIQSDSHVRVERVGADCCSQEPNEIAEAGFEASASDEDCGPCLDLQFAKEAMRTPQCTSAVQTIHSTNLQILAGNLPPSVGSGGHALRQKIPLYPLADHSFSVIHFSTVIRC